MGDPVSGLARLGTTGRNTWDMALAKSSDVCFWGVPRGVFVSLGWFFPWWNFLFEVGEDE